MSNWKKTIYEALSTEGNQAGNRIRKKTLKCQCFYLKKKAPNRCALVIMDNHILTQKKNLLALLFRMVPKLPHVHEDFTCSFRAVLFRMSPKISSINSSNQHSQFPYPFIVFLSFYCYNKRIDKKTGLPAFLIVFKKGFLWNANRFCFYFYSCSPLV